MYICKSELGTKEVRYWSQANSVKDEKECKKVAVTCTLYEAWDEVAQELSLSDIIAFKASLEPSSRIAKYFTRRRHWCHFYQYTVWISAKG